MVEQPEQPDDGGPGRERVKLNVGVNLDLGLGDLIGRVVGAPLQRASDLLCDVLGVARFELSLKLFRRAQRKLEEAGIAQQELGPVDLSRLLPILEWGSTASDESMQDRWASLLANALADPEGVPPSFPETLRQLAPREAALLEGVFDSAMADGGELGEWRLRQVEASALADAVGMVGEAYDVAIKNLLRLRVVSAVNATYPGSTREDTSKAILTGLGYAFVRACRSPTRP
jgi:hypothetical protein